MPSRRCGTSAGRRVATLLLVGCVFVGEGSAAGSEAAEPAALPEPADAESPLRAALRLPATLIPPDLAPPAAPLPTPEPPPSRAMRWGASEKSLWTGFLLASALDAYQTWSAMENPGGYREANPLYGSDRPDLARIVTLKAATAFLAYHCLDRAQPRQRRVALSVLAGLQFGVVVSNERRVEGGILVRW